MLTKYYDSMLKPDLFDAFFYGLPPVKTRSSVLNDYRVDSNSDGLQLSVDLPGVKSKDLSVQVTGRDVSITGKARGEDIKHTYRISKDYDPDTVDAVLEDGVLTLTFKKSGGLEPKTVEVRTRR